VANVGCIFCSIVSGELAAAKVLDHPDAVAFLDHSPVFAGHVLIVPRPHVVTLPDLPADQVGPFFVQVQRVAAVLPDALGCQGTWVSMNNVVSQSVAHLHVHVVPRVKKDGLKGFYWPRTKYPDEATMYSTALKIAAVLQRE
jgi:histidine triad (HIT) family protein